MEWRILFAISLLTVVVLVGGCIGDSHNSNFSPTSSSREYGHSLIIPDKVSFNATLEVISNNITLSKHSYTGIIDYQNNTADVTIGSVYRPSDPRLTGNWHTRRIVVDSNGRIKVLVSPPALWMPVPENETQSIREDIFERNPYRVLFDILKDRIRCSNCTLRVTLSHNETVRLIRSFTSEEVPSLLSLNGTVRVEDGKIILASLKGSAEDKVYAFKLGVNEK